MGLDLQYSEGQTPLDGEEREGLKIPTINTQADLDQFEQLNVEKAVAWSLTAKVKAEEVLTEEFIKELHKRMFGEVWKWAGRFRQSNKNLGIEWTKISVELRSLIDDTKFWIEQETYPPTEIAIRFKYRIVSIHCFPNGNGRHSRLMADLIMQFIFSKEPFNWQRSNMVKADRIRTTYIQALQSADKGNIGPLVEFAVC